MARHIKLLVVGNEKVGKTCLLTTYCTGAFPAAYVQTVFDSTTKNMIVDDIPVQLDLIDTAGQEIYDRLRVLAYPKTDVFLLCFNLGYRETMASVSKRWVPEVRRHCPNVPIILVGTQSDRRSQSDESFIQSTEGIKLATKIKVVKYMECSALANRGVKEVFEEAARVVLFPEAVPKQPRRFCTVL